MPARRRTGRTARLGTRRTLVRGSGASAVLAALAYVPLLAVRPGVVTPDTKTYLYLDPTRFLSQVAFMWNPTVGLGHGHPRVHRLPAADGALLRGLPPARRAGLGGPAPVARLHPLRRRARRPLPVAHPRAARPGPAAAALAYMLSPYFLQYAGRISVILLPWAGLPVHAGPHHRGPAPGRVARTRPLRPRRGAGERHQRQLHHLRRRRARSCGSSTPWSCCASRPGATRWRPALRIGVLTLGACLWWIAGLQVEAAYGVNVLKFTETVPSTSATSNAAEIVRGLGYWYFYGADHLGPWTNAAIRYTQDIALLATSYAVPVRGAGRGGVRALAGARLLPRPPLRRPGAVGRAVSLLRSRRVIGRQLKAFMTDTTAGLALRSTDRATPLVLLALVMLLAQRPHRAVEPRLGGRPRHGGARRGARRGQQPLRCSSATPSPTTSPSRRRCPPTSWRPSTTSTRPTPAPGSSPSRATTSPPTAGATRSTRPSRRSSTGTS